jgi:hypothetical protein
MEKKKIIIHKPGQKSLGENFRGGAGKGGQKFYSRFMKISRVGPKISKNVIFGPNFPIFGKNFVQGGGGG